MNIVRDIKTNPFEWIDQDCAALEKALSDKGFISPSAQVHVHWAGHLMSLHLEYRGTEFSTCETKWFNFNKGDDGFAEDKFDEAHAFIETLETPQSVARKAFQRRLGRLIDQAKEIGLDVDEPETPNIFHMLTVTMKELSENILTDQREKTDAVSG